MTYFSCTRVGRSFGSGDKRLSEIVVWQVEKLDSIDTHLKFFMRKPIEVLLKIVFEASLVRLNPCFHAKVPVNPSISIDQSERNSYFAVGPVPTIANTLVGAFSFSCWFDAVSPSSWSPLSFVPSSCWMSELDCTARWSNWLKKFGLSLLMVVWVGWLSGTAEYMHGRTHQSFSNEGSQWVSFDGGGGQVGSGRQGGSGGPEGPFDDPGPNVWLPVSFGEWQEPFGEPGPEHAPLVSGSFGEWDGRGGLFSKPEPKGDAPGAARCWEESFDDLLVLATLANSFAFASFSSLRRLAFCFFESRWFCAQDE
jgi:hypothetical protein